MGDQGWLLAHWLRALWPLSLPYLKAHLEDGKGNRRKKVGGSSLPEVQRDGRMLLPASAAARRRHLQELRGSLACGFHGWQRCGHVGQGHLLRANRCCRQGWWQEEMRSWISRNNSN